MGGVRVNIFELKKRDTLSRGHRQHLVGELAGWAVEASTRLPPFNRLLPTNTTLAWLNRYIPRTRV
jgi:hypothetical protein